MKTRRIIMIVIASMMTFSGQLMAQGFEGKGSKTLLLGLGLNQHRGYFTENGQGVKGSFNPRSGAFNIQMEFGIHDYIGLGFFTGFEAFSHLRSGIINSAIYGGYYGGLYGTSSNYWGMAVPLGMHANFHFLQLIGDKTGKDFADKLDVYAGLSFGSGVMFILPREAMKNNNPTNAKLNDVGPMFYGGGHVGIRFYPSSRVGFFAEVGYGKSIAQGGITLKL